MQLRRLFPYKNIPILVYHQITNATKDDDYLNLTVSPHSFEEQMACLYRKGYSTISLDDLVRTKCRNFTRKFAITFDDGYMDNYVNAFPVLQRFNFSATVFVVTNFMGKTHAWHSCRPTPYMDWSDCREMLNFGISFQSHTCSHPNLTAISDREALKELVESKNKIEEALGVPVNHLSYPFGRYDRTVMQLTEKAGYKAAYATGYSMMEDCCMERFQISSNDGKLRFALETSGWGSWLRSLNNLRTNLQKGGSE